MTAPIEKPRQPSGDAAGGTRDRAGWSLTKGLSAIVVIGVLSSASAAGSSDRSAGFVGRWTMDNDTYVESLREQQEKLAPGVLQNYKKLLGSEEAGSLSSW